MGAIRTTEETVYLLKVRVKVGVNYIYGLTHLLIVDKDTGPISMRHGRRMHSNDYPLVLLSAAADVK